VFLLSQQCGKKKAECFGPYRDLGRKREWR